MLRCRVEEISPNMMFVGLAVEIGLVVVGFVKRLLRRPRVLVVFQLG